MTREQNLLKAVLAFLGEPDDSQEKLDHAVGILKAIIKARRALNTQPQAFESALEQARLLVEEIETPTGGWNCFNCPTCGAAKGGSWQPS